MSKICGIKQYVYHTDSGQDMDMVRISFSDDIPKDKGKGFDVGSVSCSLKRFSGLGLTVDSVQFGKECLILYDRFGKFSGISYSE